MGNRGYAINPLSSQIIKKYPNLSLNLAKPLHSIESSRIEDNTVMNLSKMSLS